MDVIRLEMQLELKKDFDRTVFAATLSIWIVPERNTYMHNNKQTRTCTLQAM